ncbi:hypothetical protein EV421DRAFT_2042511 [Armillaria borealis]|uniref:Uncharacterized protein n=1 Tax=Armillaria borealis TaxID=47425 RepID=A0AA39IU61_9AGAR|nr:hypothetical protein EV421DRAFT_2042511 [Armillaria borealis]
MKSLESHSIPLGLKEHKNRMTTKLRTVEVITIVSIPSSRNPPAVPFPPSCCPLFLTSISHLVYCTTLLIAFDVERSTLVVSHHDSENEREFDLASAVLDVSWSRDRKVAFLVIELLFLDSNNDCHVDWRLVVEVNAVFRPPSVSDSSVICLRVCLPFFSFPKLTLQHGADDSLDSSLVHVAGAPYAGDNDEFRPMDSKGGTADDILEEVFDVWAERVDIPNFHVTLLPLRPSFQRDSLHVLCHR